MRRATKIYVDHEAEAKLADFGITVTDCMHVVGKVVGARHEAVVDDPLGAAGLFAYIYGVRNVRGLFKAKGWKNYRAENVEAVRDPETGRLVIYQSVDLAGVLAHQPLAPRGKGNGAARLIEAAHGLLLFGEDEIPEVIPAYVGEAGENWYFCVSFEKNDEGELEVGAELSLALPLKGGNFDGFSERIIILQHGPWRGGAREEVPTGDAAEFEPTISRKQQ